MNKYISRAFLIVKFALTNLLITLSWIWNQPSRILLRDELQIGSVITPTVMPASFVTHWGRVTHICISKLTIAGSHNGLSPGRRQAIIWTNAGILLIGPLGTNFSEILSEIRTFSFKKIHLKTSSGKWRPCCLGLNVLINFSQGQAELTHHMTRSRGPFWYKRLFYQHRNSHYKDSSITVLSL